MVTISAVIFFCLLAWACGHLWGFIAHKPPKTDADMIGGAIVSILVFAVLAASSLALRDCLAGAYVDPTTARQPASVESSPVPTTSTSAALAPSPG